MSSPHTSSGNFIYDLVQILVFQSLLRGRHIGVVHASTLQNEIQSSMWIVRILKCICWCRIPTLWTVLCKSVCSRIRISKQRSLSTNAFALLQSLHRGPVKFLKALVLKIKKRADDMMIACKRISSTQPAKLAKLCKATLGFYTTVGQEVAKQFCDLFLQRKQRSARSGSKQDETVWGR